MFSQKIPQRQTLKRWLRQLDSLRASRRAEAEEALRNLGPDAIPLLVEFLQEGLRKRVAYGTYTRYAVIGYLSLFLLSMFLVPAFGFVLFFLALIALPILTELSSFTRVQQNAGRVLAEMEDVRCIGPLLEALAFDDAVTHRAVGTALTHLLPRLQAEDAASLDRVQRDYLHRALLGSSDADFLVAGLKALEKVGNSDALPIVERLTAYKERPFTTREGQTLYLIALGSNPILYDLDVARQRALTGDAPANAREAQVRAAAEACLVVLRPRAQQEQASQTLLRASDASTLAPAHMLLRPAAGTVASDLSPEQLLRASPPESEP